MRNRLTWLRFCGLRPGDAVPDVNTLWDCCVALIKAGRIPEEWKEQPAKLRQRDRNDRWTTKWTPLNVTDLIRDIRKSGGTDILCRRHN
ncbi:hypothetical protein [Novispirillum itersonii]|uniref:Transposase InsH N-terminal domain-containing protein n=1 Tax=Novispirillum itersonii TaxID=189 RepID=A0A7W9ZGU5_NOVIT|nr:hypothetical protein [Novispirillum itersonii]MBB6210372.1 hypothetical protein [Novispirillum itersonii]